MKTVLEWLLEEFPDTPKTRAKQWITSGRVSVNGEIVRQPNRTVADQPQLRERNTALDCGPDGWQIHPRVSLLYLDAALAVVNKGPGLLSVSTEQGELSAQSILGDFLAGKLRGRVVPPTFRRLQPLPVHRLDQFTSGVFCLAMNPTAREGLIAQLRRREMKREYVAYVEGRPAKANGTWRNRLKLSADELRQFIADDGVEATTHYEVVEQFPLATKLRLRLETGRKHQIRAQAAHAGMPLIGDRTYNPKGRIDFPRQALHAEVLSLEHPDKESTRLIWTAELPRDLRQLEATLRKRSPRS